MGWNIDARARLDQVERATRSEASTLVRSVRARQTQQQASTYT